jgi:hypothetical protein
VDDIPGHVTHCDIGIEQGGTAFGVQDGITLTDIKRHPIGQAILE